MQSKRGNTSKDLDRQTNVASMHMDADYRAGVGKELEQQHNALCIYAAWLVRAVIRRAGIETHTSRLADYSAQPALTSHPDNCTVGTPRHCNTGDSNK